MSRMLPIHTDEHGRRWAVLTPKAAGRLVPDHSTRSLTAEGETVPRLSSKEILRFLRSVIGSDRSALYGVYLLGDSFHQDECYDITAYVTECLSDENPTRFGTAERLAGRHLVFVWGAESASPNWWTDNLSDILSSVAEESDADGILLSMEWGLSYDPDAPEIPWRESFESFRPEIAWLFQTGEPSVRVRGAYFQEASRLAVSNLAEAGKRLPSGMRLGVALPLSKRREWLVSPQEFAPAGIAPFVAGSGEQVFRDEGLLRLSESAGYAFFLPSGLVGEDAIGYLTAWGISASRLPLLDSRLLAPSSCVLLLNPREDRWAHGWDDSTDYFSEQARRIAEALMERGIAFLTTNETRLAETLRRMEPRLLMLAPARHLGSATLSTVSEWVAARHPVVWMEPVPYLADGKPSKELDALLRRFSRRRLEFEGRHGEKAFDTFLRKAKVSPAFGVFRRENGEPLHPLWRLTFEMPPHRGGAFLHRKADSVPVLVEAEEEREAETWDGREWISVAHWHTEGRTFFEVNAKPSVWVFFRLL